MNVHILLPLMGGGVVVFDLSESPCNQTTVLSFWLGDLGWIILYLM